MQLDGNFYKKEVTELKPEISQRRKNIETYLITRYNMNLSFAQQITSILEKTSLDDKDLRSGMNDSVIELAIKQMTEKRTSSLMMLNIFVNKKPQKMLFHLTRQIKLKIKIQQKNKNLRKWEENI